MSASIFSGASDELVGLGRFVEARVPRHQILAVDQNAVKGDHQRCRFPQVNRLRNHQSKNSLSRPDFNGRSWKLADTSELGRRGRSGLTASSRGLC